MMESHITNEYHYNVKSKTLDLPHHAPLSLTQSPYIKRRYPATIKRLVHLAKTSPSPDGPVKPLHITIITETTSDAEEQYVLLTIYWKALGLKKANAHNYRKLTPAEIAKIREMFIAGRSIYAIAKALDRSPSTIYYCLKRLNMI